MRTHKKDIGERILNIASQIKLSKWPPFLAYNPHSFALKGRHTRDIMKVVQPGDILVRSFNGYLNNIFLPGAFKHVGFYLGQVTDNHLRKIANLEYTTHFVMGPQIVIHAIKGNIILEDLIDFCRCDGLAVMRFPGELKSLYSRQIPEALATYFTTFTEPQEGAQPSLLVKNERDVAQHLAKGSALKFEKIFKLFYQIALNQLTAPYEFELGVDAFDATASTEFVYFITKSICWNYGIEPVSKKILFKPRQIIEPDNYVNSDLEEVWKAVR